MGEITCHCRHPVISAVLLFWRKIFVSSGDSFPAQMSVSLV